VCLCAGPGNNQSRKIVIYIFPGVVGKFKFSPVVVENNNVTSYMQYQTNLFYHFIGMV
jgi:hypothetical protein